MTINLNWILTCVGIATAIAGFRHDIIFMEVAGIILVLLQLKWILK